MANQRQGSCGDVRGKRRRRVVAAGGGRYDRREAAQHLVVDRGEPAEHASTAHAPTFQTHALGYTYPYPTGAPFRPRTPLDDALARGCAPQARRLAVLGQAARGEVESRQPARQSTAGGEHSLPTATPQTHVMCSHVALQATRRRVSPGAVAEPVLHDRELHRQLVQLLCIVSVALKPLLKLLHLLLQL